MSDKEYSLEKNSIISVSVTSLPKSFGMDSSQCSDMNGTEYTVGDLENGKILIKMDRTFSTWNREEVGRKTRCF